MSHTASTNPHIGLTSAEVNDRLAAGQSNAQRIDPSRNLASIIRGNVVNLFNGVVGGCFLLLAVLGQWKDTLFGFALLSNLLIGIIQEYSAKRTLDRLADLNQPLARVKRDGEVIDSALYRVDDYRHLTWLGSDDTSRKGWPCCQRRAFSTPRSGP